MRSQVEQRVERRARARSAFRKAVAAIGYREESDWYQSQLRDTAAVIALVQGGKLILLASTGAKRPGIVSDVPTMIESGIKDYVVNTWMGFATPAGVPEPVVARLHAELVKILNQPDVRDRIVNDGSEPVGNTPAEFSQVIASDLQKWGAVVRANNIKAE